MHFLVDAQLPPALLARWLTDQGHQAEHVIDLGMGRANDSDIWESAGRHRAALITKDDDFVTLVSLSPNGAKVVWVRVGNTTRRALLSWFAPLLTQIEEALSSGEELVEVI